MKLWIMGLSLCLLARAELSAQFASDSTNRLIDFARTYGVDPLNSRAETRTGPRATGASVISLEQLKQQTNKNGCRLMKKGAQEYARRNFTRAAALWQEAAALDPRSAALRNNLGVVYQELGSNKQAKEWFLRAIAVDPSAAVSYTNLAAVRFDDSEYDAAEMAARQALRLAPSSPRAKLLLGLAEVAQDKWTPEARRVLEEAGSQCSQAQRVLEYWPRVEVRNSGSSQASGLGTADRSERPQILPANF